MKSAIIINMLKYETAVLCGGNNEALYVVVFLLAIATNQL